MLKEETMATLKGQFLSAMPGLVDPNFFQTVTCLCEHTSQGAVGIVVNRMHGSLTAKDIFQELNIDYTPGVGSLPVHVGGPVHVNEIFVLHGMSSDWNGTVKITPKIGVTNTGDIVEAIARGRGPESFIICLGCAGWAPGQLEYEIKKNAWLISPADEEIIFHLPIGTRWEGAVRKMGIDPVSLSDMAGHA
ncbi:MAG: YqgE/AlgH family protein [Desulfobacterales bacterium]|nr:YqgE/AlgH family protein [Desulfobacterales bacterium]